MKIRFFAALVILGLMVSCNSVDPQTEALQKLKTEVIDIHDEVMPKMSELDRLQHELGEAISDSLDSTQVDFASLQHKIATNISVLESAGDGMMDWMYEYRNDADKNMSPDSAKSYFESEKVRITKVKTEMLNAMTAAEDLLAELKSSKGEGN